MVKLLLGMSVAALLCHVQSSKNDCPRLGEPDLYLAPPVSTASNSLVVVDCVTAGNATKLAATTLQGVLNSHGKSGANVYLLLASWDAFWLATLQQRRLLPPTGSVLTPAQFFATNAKAYTAVVVPDALVPATINVATMMAAADGRTIAADQSMVALLGEGKNVTDLRGRWNSSVAAYRWAFEELYMKKFLAPTLFAYYHPYWLDHHLRDYLIAHKVFTWYISAADGDDGVQLMTDILARSGEGTVVGFIGGGPIEDPNAFNEYSGVALMGQYGKLTTVADWSTNLSYLSAMKAAAALLESAITSYRSRTAAALARERESVPLNYSKVYLSIGVVESGDAPVYWQDRQWKVWNDTARGALPISWGTGKGIFELAPAIALYFIEEATGNDYLYGAISGLAYVHPYRNLMSSLPESAIAWDRYWQRASCYLERFGANATGVYTDAWKSFSRVEKDSTTQAILRSCSRCAMLILGMGRDEGMNLSNGNYMLSGRSVSHILTRWPENWSKLTNHQLVDWLVSDITAQLGDYAERPPTRPRFMQAMALSWAYGPSEMQAVATALPEWVQIVSIERYHELFLDARSISTPQRRLMGK